PREKLLERGDRGRWRLDGAVAADHRDAERTGVEAERMRADDRFVDAAVSAFEHLAVLVDEEVVADVIPAVALDVVDLDAAHDRCRFAARGVVRAGRVMHAGIVDAVAVLRSSTADLLISLPAKT